MFFDFSHAFCGAQQSTAHSHIDILNIIRIWLQINEALDGSFCYTSFHINFFSTLIRIQSILFLSIRLFLAYSLRMSQFLDTACMHFVTKWGDGFRIIFCTGIWQRKERESEREKIIGQNFVANIFYPHFMFCLEHLWKIYANI